jgi:hypothetical protein
VDYEVKLKEDLSMANPSTAWVSIPIESEDEDVDSIWRMVENTLSHTYGMSSGELINELKSKFNITKK